MNSPALFVAIAYILGSIPFGLIIFRLAEGKDIRESGSGNIGATNVLRSGKKWQGVLTLLLDGGKGALAVLLAKWFLDPSEVWLWASLAAFAAIFGHVFNIFLHFKGGKGVAAGCGAYLALMPLAALSTLAIFVVFVLFTRYVSLGSIVATAAFPALGWLYGYGGGQPGALWIAAASSALIVGMHHTNIVRLCRGTENRIGQKKQNP